MLTFDQAAGIAIQLSIILTCWVVVSVCIALFVGRVIRLADERDRRSPSKPSEFSG